MFALLELAGKRHVQEKLRAEIVDTLGRIRSRGDSDFTANDFDSMPYLVAVGKVCQEWTCMLTKLTPHSAQETLRLYSVANELARTAAKDDVLPLSKPIVGLSGKVYKDLLVPAGTIVTISTVGYNLYVVPLLHIPPESWWLRLVSTQEQGRLGT